MNIHKVKLLCLLGFVYIQHSKCAEIPNVANGSPAMIEETCKYLLPPGSRAFNFGNISYPVIEKTPEVIVDTIGNTSSDYLTVINPHKTTFRLPLPIITHLLTSDLSAHKNNRIIFPQDASHRVIHLFPHMSTIIEKYILHQGACIFSEETFKAIDPIITHITTKKYTFCVNSLKRMETVINVYLLCSYLQKSNVLPIDPLVLNELGIFALEVLLNSYFSIKKGYTNKQSFTFADITYKYIQNISKESAPWFIVSPEITLRMHDSEIKRYIHSLSDDYACFLVNRFSDIFTICTLKKIPKLMHYAEQLEHTQNFIGNTLSYFMPALSFTKPKDSFSAQIKAIINILSIYFFVDFLRATKKNDYLKGTMIAIENLVNVETVKALAKQAAELYGLSDQKTVLPYQKK